MSIYLQSLHRYFFFILTKLLFLASLQMYHWQNKGGYIFFSLYFLFMKQLGSSTLGLNYNNTGKVKKLFPLLNASLIGQKTYIQKLIHLYKKKKILSGWSQ